MSGASAAEIGTASIFTGVQLLPEREVLEGQFLMPAAGKRQRSRNQQHHVHPAVTVSRAQAKINPEWGRMQL